MPLRSGGCSVIRFQKATPTEALTIVKTRHKVWETSYRGIYPDEMIDDYDYRWHVQKECARLMNPQFHCYMVMDGDSCVGYFSYGKVCYGTWKDFEFRLHSFYLQPEYQGRGLGRKIFAQIKEECLRQGYSKLFLDCHPDNHKALGFYRHMGGTIANYDYGTGSREEFGCTVEFYFD